MNGAIGWTLKWNKQRYSGNMPAFSQRGTMKGWRWRICWAELLHSFQGLAASWHCRLCLHLYTLRQWVGGLARAWQRHRWKAMRPVVCCLGTRTEIESNGVTESLQPQVLLDSFTRPANIHWVPTLPSSVLNTGNTVVIKTAWSLPQDTLILRESQTMNKWK